MRVLLVEDEKALAAALSKIMSKNNIVADVSYDGEEGYLLAQRDIYDVIILDIMLPNKSGLDILKDLRSENIKTPILLLTARDTIKDRVDGLDSGADDYLVKPFATEELLARIRALGRRSKDFIDSKILEMGNTKLYINNGELEIEGNKKKLTAKESQLLELFLRHPRMVLSKEQILERIWGIEGNAMENNVEIYIHYLRKKLGSKSNLVIETVRGIGYVLKEKDRNAK
ncbi:response regulator transcription factor [Garciella nitratireducens]|uniref:Stage 0 sporulation protein A homolog n=1 Tax=Garciella nitratireducens DSM 15102 TaxID=1121911 RepID=A0A1T4NCP4_9FIRM|nr:response regulator transcription factor [Garciella nitratireducens]RBP44079.1 DNA-binding response OmpR family regulator [Garciella nitratireducens]SJZ76905.1 DNA-binding response regulator, OmpR family, contains REC and winged-helix (wHTH) domain [Garciella nitratireducens DSM 15102]